VLVGVTLVVFLGAGLVLLSLLLPDKWAALKLFGAALSGVATFVGIVDTVWRWRRPADPRPVDALADLLAQAVYGQWHKEAIERVLVTPAPIPVSWSLSDLLVAGPVGAALGSTSMAPAFPPLPGQTRITEDHLRAGGQRGELFAVYAGIASGRLVVVGAPGAGKTGSAILLLLDALDHRDHVEDKDRTRVPVPVLMTAHGWDPTTCSVKDWLAARLVADYPLLQHRGGQAEANNLVDARDKVALILDGLDEMDLARRPAALQALSDAPFRVVVLSRSQEMVQAAGSAWLVGAVVVHLHAVAGSQAADYLQQARTGPPPAGWTQLLTYLRENSAGVLAQGLSTPLALTLIRDTYRAGDDVSELLDVTRFSAADDIEQHLIAGVLRDAYTPRPGRPKPRYSLMQAQQTLALLARQLKRDHARDLAWWHIPRWVPSTPRILATGLAVAFVGELLVSFVAVLPPYPDTFNGALWVGLVYGVPIVLVALLAGRLTAGVAGRLAVSVAAGLGHGDAQRRTKTMIWSALRSRPALLAGLAVGLVVGLVVGLDSTVDPALDPGAGLGPKLAVRVPMIGLPIAFVTWLAGGLAGGLTASGAAEGGPLGPRESWRHDRRVALASGLVYGLAFGLAFGLVLVLLYGSLTMSSPDPLKSLKTLLAAVEGGLAVWVGAGISFGLGVSQAWQTTVAWRQLHFAHRVPPIALMPFLKDAQDRGVLRTAGAVYQFRHALLQDQLAKPLTGNSSTSLATHSPP
jgi:hypothetical protein